MLAALAQQPSAFSKAVENIRSGLEQPAPLFTIGLTLLILFFWYFATDIERRKRNVGTILLLGITFLCVLAATPPSERLKGGIDIRVGSSFTLRVQPKEVDGGKFEPPTPHQVDQAIAILRKRLDSAGTQEAQINRLGADQIQVQMPGVSDEESAEIRKT
ncbi:MAG TPA: hypothetical protein VM511_05555, partial [Luteolibacter sp.]|nr:hypothetical protein [Luteolibacter sp.]